MTASIDRLSPAGDSEFVEFWNDILAPKFVRFRHILVDGLAQHSAVVFPTLPVQQGDRVLDVGCGFGDAAIVLARMVAPNGEVVGVDCCDAFLDYARNDAAAKGVGNLRFVRGDAEIIELPQKFDLVFSRFGMTFFNNPVAGLRNTREMLRPGGRVTNIVWRITADNPWLGMAKDIVLKFLPEPTADAETCGPGPFSMADETTAWR